MSDTELGLRPPSSHLANVHLVFEPFTRPEEASRGLNHWGCRGITDELLARVVKQPYISLGLGRCQGDLESGAERASDLGVHFIFSWYAERVLVEVRQRSYAQQL